MMAKYEVPRIAQLYIEKVLDNLTIKNFKYKITKTIGSKIIYTSKHLMFDKNKTIPIIIHDSMEKIQIDVYLNSKWFNGYILKHYKADATIKFDKASLKSTDSLNSENTNHIKGLSISTKAEVGWLLVKKEQTFDSLLRLIYKKVPNHTELDIFRHANAHISDLQDLNLNKKIKPGQIIIITNKKSSPELTEYKKLALDAEKIYQSLCLRKGFDPIFFANNFELLMNYVSLAKETQIAKIEYEKTIQGHKESYCGSVTINKEVESLNAISTYASQSKEKLDNIKIDIEQERVKLLNENLLKQLDSDFLALQKAKAEEIRNKTKEGNNKHNSDFKRKNYEIYQRIEKSLSQNFALVIQNRDLAKTLKNIVNDNSGVRGKDFLGGLKPIVQSMEHIGNATISMKLGLKVVFYFYIIDSATKIYGAYQTGDSEYTLKVTTVETLNITGGVAGGALGAMIAGSAAGWVAGSKFGLILGIPTGGTSVVVAGAIGAAVGAVAGGFAGNYAGTTIGREITGVCD